MAKVEITLSGLAGSGKTRIAQIIAHAALHAGMSTLLEYLESGDDRVTVDTTPEGLAMLAERSKGDAR